MAVVCILSVLALGQNSTWKSEKTLWEHTLAVSPSSAKSYVNLGVYHAGKGNFEFALPLFLKGRQFNPMDDNYDYWRGYLSYQNGDPAAALEAFKLILLRDPDSCRGNLAMGGAYEALGDFAKARESYTRVLRTGKIVAADLARDKARYALQRLQQAGK